MIDIHSHLLPGLDDGAKSWDETLAMARIAREDGVKVMAATPHMMWDGQYANRAPDVLALVAEAQERLERAGIDLAVVAGGEIYVSPETPGGIKSGELLTYGGQRRFALIEFPSNDVPPFADQVFFDCQLQGVKLVLAHPERNAALMSDLGRVVSWIERGLYLQVNTRSLLGDSGGRVQQAAEQLLRRHLVHFVASDAHSSTRRPPGLSQARARLEAIVGQEMAQALVSENPRRLLDGEAIKVWDPVSPRRRGLLGRLFRRAAGGN